MFFRSCCFSVNFVLGFVTLFGVLTVIDKLPGLSFSIYVLLVLPLLIASMIEGKVFARLKKSRPAAKDCWLTSLKMMVIVSLIVFAVGLVRIALDTDRIDYLLSTDMSGLGLALSASAILGWVLLRVGYAIGLASELKGQHISHQY